VVHGIVFGERPSAHAANALLPATFDQVLGRGMAARAQDRFANCAEFASALDNALHAAPPAAPPVVAGPAASPATRARRRTMPLVAGSFVLALALGGAAAYKFWPALSRTQREQTKETRPTGAAAQPATLPAQADSPPPKTAEDSPPIETGTTSVKKKNTEAADASPPPKEIEHLPAVVPQQPPINRTVVVRSDRPWTFTGIVLGATDAATITASGAIQIATDKRIGHQQPGGFYPDCNRPKELFGQPAGAVPAPNLSCWSLIGRVGPHGTIFAIGVQGTVPAGLTGRLFLGVNDDNYADNSGTWSALVTVEHK
jgi:hypothetical protein